MAFFLVPSAACFENRRRGKRSVRNGARDTPKQNEKGAVAGWVAGTDARIKGRGGEADSDEDATPVMIVARGNSEARLRKGRPRRMHESGSLPSASQDGSSVGVDGWITNSHGPTGAGASTSVGRGRTSEGTRSSCVCFQGVPNDTNAITELDIQHRRAATTTATSSRKASETHARSASLSLVDTLVTLASTSTSTSGGTSWRKLLPPFESEPQPASLFRQHLEHRLSWHPHNTRDDIWELQCDARKEPKSDEHRCRRDWPFAK